MLSFTMQVPWTSTASQGITIPLAGMEMTSPGTSSVDMACSSSAKNGRKRQEPLTEHLWTEAVCVCVCVHLWDSHLEFPCTPTPAPRCGPPPCHAASHIAVVIATTLKLTEMRTERQQKTGVGTHLFERVQRGRDRNDRHDHYRRGVIVVVIGAPENHAEELEDVERI